MLRYTSPCCTSTFCYVFAYIATSSVKCASLCCPSSYFLFSIFCFLVFKFFHNREKSLRTFEMFAANVVSHENRELSFMPYFTSGDAEGNVVLMLMPVVRRHNFFGGALHVVRIMIFFGNANTNARVHLMTQVAPVAGSSLMRIVSSRQSGVSVWFLATPVSSLCPLLLRRLLPVSSFLSLWLMGSMITEVVDCFGVRAVQALLRPLRVVGGVNKVTKLSEHNYEVELHRDVRGTPATTFPTEMVLYEHVYTVDQPSVWTTVAAFVAQYWGRIGWMCDTTDIAVFSEEEPLLDLLGEHLSELAHVAYQGAYTLPDAYAAGGRALDRRS